MPEHEDDLADFYAEWWLDVTDHGLAGWYAPACAFAPAGTWADWLAELVDAAETAQGTAEALTSGAAPPAAADILGTRLVSQTSLSWQLRLWSPN